MGQGSDALNDHMYEFDQAESRHYEAVERDERMDSLNKAEELGNDYKVFIDNYFKNYIGHPSKQERKRADQAWKNKHLKTIKTKTDMKVEGNIKVIDSVQTFKSGFTKQQIVVTTNDTYPQEVPIQFTKDNIAKLDLFGVGMNVSVSINIRGNENKGKYYASLEGWKIESID